MKTLIIITAILITACITFSQRTYVWSGAVNSNFSTAGNWNPVRQVGYADDKLVFNSGTTLSVTNVYQVTVGQISVINNTQLMLAPSSGNPRILYIEGISESQNMGNDNEHGEISHVKYDEYMVDDNKDLASQKYDEYMKSDSSNIATLKYNEYTNPPVKGMGDLKEELTYDSNTDDDLLIESGSSLTIQATDPTLSVFLKHDATAAIFGSVIYSGEGENSLNSNDAFAISFKEGGVLVQSCPGSIFTNNGINNSVMFESGSTFEINHQMAKDPFGMTPPSSKLIFDENSVYKVRTNNPNVLKLNGRTFPNIIIGQNCDINVHDILTTDFSVNNLTIETGGKLHVKNLNNSAAPNVNIKGDLTVNGELHFMPDTDNKLILNFNRGSGQVISGSGIIEFGSGIQSFNIYNDLTLNRDIDAYCHVIHRNGTINTDGHIFRIFNQYTSTQMLFVGILIMPESSPEMNRPHEENNNNTIKGSNLPAAFSISQNYPNPFNPKTKIDYGIPKQSHVTISVFDLTGKKVADLVNETKDAQFYTSVFDGSNMASGIYFYRISAQSGNETYAKSQKMCLVK